MHVAFEDAASIGTWAQQHGHSLSYTHLYQGQRLPEVESFDLLAIMGGPMNIYEHDAYPWLVAEKTFIKKAIDAGKKVIGVCLGAQLIADVLGGNVTAGVNKEIGWFPIKLTPKAIDHSVLSNLPGKFDVFHWHGDTFSIPPGAMPLAASDACNNQGFQFGNHVLGLQFHMEYTTESIEKMLDHCADEIVDAPHIQNAETIRDGYEKIPQTTQLLFKLLDEFTA
jgi:GMP synthase (glutamine-hydrolysing)